jgi:hypothetical protein
MANNFIVTDHNPLTYLNNVSLSSARLTRWRLKLAEYNFKILYKKGSLNSNADYLSRAEFDLDKNSVHKEEVLEFLLAISNNEEKFKDRIIYHEKDDVFNEKNIAICSSKNLSNFKSLLKQIKN